MTLDDFIKKYKGKFVEYHSYGTGALNQCVDSVNQYITEVLGLQAIIGTDAQDFPSKASKTDYDYILNTPSGIPQKGDIIIWVGTWGHIAIFYEGDVNSFTSFDQNFPTGSPCQFVAHSYQSVKGWLHPKNVPVNSMSNELQICLQQHTKLVEECNEKFKTIQNLTAERDSYKQQLKEANDKVCEKEAQIAKLEPVVNEMEKFKATKYGTTFLEIDTYIRLIETNLEAIQNSTTPSGVLSDSVVTTSVACDKCVKNINNYTTYELIKFILKKILK